MRPTGTLAEGAPVRLVVLAIAEITAASDVFACRPLGAKLAAGACVARQLAADPAKRLEASPGDRVKMAPIAFLTACRACPDGENVARRLEVKIAPAPRRGRPAAAWPLTELSLATTRHVAAALLACKGSRRDVAARIGVPFTELQRLAQCTVGARVRRASLEAIARATGVTTEQLLAGQGPDGSPLPHLDVARRPPRRVVRPAR